MVDRSGETFATNSILLQQHVRVAQKTFDPSSGTASRQTRIRERDVARIAPLAEERAQEIDASIDASR